MAVRLGRAPVLLGEIAIRACREAISEEWRETGRLLTGMADALARGEAPDERARREQAEIDAEVRHSAAGMERAARRAERLRAREASAREDERRWLLDQVLEMRRLGWKWDELDAVGMGRELFAGLGQDGRDVAGEEAVPLPAAR